MSAPARSAAAFEAHEGLEDEVTAEASALGETEPGPNGAPVKWWTWVCPACVEGRLHVAGYSRDHHGLLHRLRRLWEHLRPLGPPAMRDCLADIAALAEIDLAESPDAYSKAMRRAYWEDKDLAGAIAIAFGGISRLLAEARGGPPERASALRNAAKQLTYDLASFTWPGWDEPGIIVTPPEMRAGFAAARANLRMARELGKGDLPTARAHWILGAHELAAGHPDDAQTSFRQAAAAAERADEPGEAGLARAFEALATTAQEPAAAPLLEDALERLAEVDGGAALVSQVTTARDVLDL